MKIAFHFLIIIFFYSPFSYGQISAKLMRYMDVSDTQIVFVYGGDIWTVPKEGGTAAQLTRSPGEESWPRFSPDGKELAFTASYNGNQDIYVMPVTGGVPVRVTYQSHSDRMIDWHPDGERLLFASTGENGGRRLLNQFFLVRKAGGLPEKMPLPYGELASFSPDGSQLAYITKITENYPFKRIRSGYNSDILLFDIPSNKVENITDRKAIDGKPAWSGNTVYFLSDENEDMRINIWAYRTDTKTMEQLTDFKDFDISYLSAGDKDLVFEVGGELYLMDLASHDYRKITVNVISDLAVEIPQQKDVSKNIAKMAVAPDGKRVLFEARGEVFNVPAKEGYSVNLTRSSGAFDHSPSWSPDGKHVAFWSDRSGEFEIWLQENQNKQEAKQLTHREKGFGYSLHWSPDSKKIAFIDEKNDISVLDVGTAEIQTAGNTYWHVPHGAKSDFPIHWSPDSKWLAFSQIMENAQGAIFLYQVETKELSQATSGFFSDIRPVFSQDGKYLFFQTNRKMEAAYSSLGDNTWIYPNAAQLAVINLNLEAPSILPPKNDEILQEKEDKTPKEKDKEAGEKEDKPVQVDINLDDMESRVMLLPTKAGNIGKMVSIKDKLIFHRYPYTGTGMEDPVLMCYDIKEREEKVIMEKVKNFEVSADGKSILVASGSQYGIIKPDADQKLENPVPTKGLVMQLVPREEWEQIFQDTWRRYRDYFYDPEMQQVDWESMRERYGALIKDARTRWDVINIQSNMLSELGAGHTYTFGGDTESVEPKITGFLGIDWEQDGNLFRIQKIVKPAQWDTEVRSPFDRPGVEVKPGDIIVAVNGIPLDPEKDPYAAFEGLGGETVAVTLLQKSGQSEERKEVVITCLTQNEERSLRYLEWIENNRKTVDSLSDGRLGYIYMSNTASAGQRELVSMFYGQLDKKGFIIDERFNAGGQLADRFLELMKRPVVYNLHWRYGRDHTQPIKTNTGPMGMLINGWAGSGGDGLPWAFKELQAGPIVGENTLGILVGPATGHTLIDGGGITVPDARLYDNEGHWFWEGEGVSPDIAVWDDPNLLMQGRDPQLERVVKEVLDLLEKNPTEMTPAPDYEDRTSKGIRNKD